MRKLVIHIMVGLWILGLGAHSGFALDSSLKQALELDRQNFLAESIPAWQKFLQTGPGKKLHVYAQVKITVAYSKTGNFGEALKSSKALVGAFPDQFDAQFNLGNMLSATHQYAEAVQAFEKASALRPTEGLAYVGHGLSLFGAEKPEEAVVVLRKVRKLFKQQKNIAWYQHVRIMIGQIKGFAHYPPSFSELWRANNLKKVRDTYESAVLKTLEKDLDL